MLVLAGEVGLRVVHFQRRGNHPVAILSAIDYLKFLVMKREIVKKRPELKDLLTVEGELLRKELEKNYSQAMGELVAAVENAKARLLILYIPADRWEGRDWALMRDYVRELTTRHQLDFVDMVPVFKKYPSEYVKMLPKDIHLSRFGHKLVAGELVQALEKYQGYQAGTNYEGEPVLLGDIKPSLNVVWGYELTRMPYEVVTNRHGFRKECDLDIPKKRQRILILGDSITFGSYLAGHDTYPEILEGWCPETEVINAGVWGYTITDELSLFKSRAKQAAPDIVVLQIFDNDLVDLLSHQRNVFAREGRGEFTPSLTESIFMKYWEGLRE